MEAKVDSSRYLFLLALVLLPTVTCGRRIHMEKTRTKTQSVARADADEAQVLIILRSGE